MPRSTELPATPPRTRSSSTSGPRCAANSGGVVAESTDARPVMVITGAARGIGAAVALAAAPTHDLVVNYVARADAANAVADEARAAGALVLVHRADVGVEAEVVDMFAAVDDRFGQLDVLVNNAGIAGGYGRLESVTAEALAALRAATIT